MPPPVILHYFDRSLKNTWTWSKPRKVSWFLNFHSKNIDFDAYHIFVKLQWSEIEYIEWAKRVIPKIWMSKTRDSLNLKLGWMKFCNDMNQKRCASKNVLTRNFTKMQKSEKRKIKIPPTMIRTSFFNTNYEGVHIENRKRKAKPKSQIRPTINSVTGSRYRITSAPLTSQGVNPKRS